jgi:hypothetical protein
MDREGYVVLMNLPEAWHTELDVLGFRPETLSLMWELYARWDPASILQSELPNL